MSATWCNKHCNGQYKGSGRGEKESHRHTGGQGSLFKGGNTPIEALKETHFRQREQPVQRHEAAYLGQYVEND